MATINTFDRSLKVIARNHADLFLRLALPDLPLTLINQPENVELSLPVQPVDFVHRILHQEQELLFHLEFQLEHFADFPRRVCHVHGALTQQFKLPVLSFAIYLQRRKAPIPNEYLVEINQIPINRFSYPVIKLWDYVEQIRNGQLRALAPLLVILEEEPSAETLQVERQLILAAPDPAKRADLLAIAVTLASRLFDRDFLRRFFREELVQMQHATLIDEWLEEAVEKAVQATEAKATAQGIAIGKIEGMHERAVTSILRILTIRFGITTLQKEPAKIKLNAIVDLSTLDALEEQALTAFTFSDFNRYLDELLAAKAHTGSGQ